MIFTQLSLEAPLSVIASPVLLSLRAERGNLSEVPDCFVVRQLTDFLAMTEGGHWEPLYLSLRAPSYCHCERSVAISARYQIAEFVPSRSSERREEPSEESRLEIASSSLTSCGIPRNDGRGCYYQCSELISLAENTK